MIKMLKDAWLFAVFCVAVAFWLGVVIGITVSTSKFIIKVLS